MGRGSRRRPYRKGPRVSRDAPKREQRYTVTPNPTTATADDDFGFNETTSFYQDAKNYDEESGEDKLNQE